MSFTINITILLFNTFFCRLQDELMAKHMDIKILSEKIMDVVVSIVFVFFLLTAKFIKLFKKIPS